MLLLVPLLIMSLAYLLIVSKLWRGMRREIRHSSSCKQTGEWRSRKSDAVAPEVALGKGQGGWISRKCGGSGSVC